MVHLAPDSRLLVSLVKQEQAYTAQFHSLLNASGASLSALSVYASSSPPTISSVLNGVAGALSGADEALRAYGEALNDWIDQLGNIRFKEEEVANIGRDREILVTRLLKVSQKSKSPPPSLLHAPPDPSSSSSFASFSSKFTAAQTELQACESHLAEKERELEQTRIHAIRQGLKTRCTALVQCGWAWGEMGRRALTMLDSIESVQPPAKGHASEFFKPLPDPNRDHDHDSLLSSLSPSQSASQIGSLPPIVAPTPEKPYRIDIPPPHLVTEHVIPDSSNNPSPLHAEPEASNTSSEDEGPVEVHENPRFQPEPILKRRSQNLGTASSTPARGSPVPLPSPAKSRGTHSDIGPSNRSTKTKREREKKHAGFLGSLASLFKTSITGKPGSLADSRWDTRTEQNLKSMKSDGEQSTDEETQPRAVRLRKARGRSTAEKPNGWVKTDLTGADPSPLSVPSPPSDPTALKRKKSGGKLGKSGTIRSTMSEPTRAPRARATTLTSSTPRPTIQHSLLTAPQQRRGASMDGRWGLSDQVSPSTSRRTPSPTPTPTRNSAKSAPVGKGDSLMSIIEGVTRSNQAAWSHAHSDPSSRLEVVRAPGSSVPSLPLLIHPPPPLPGTASVPSSPTTPNPTAFRRSSVPVPLTTGLLVQPSVEKKPLRSALRNPSKERSTSPSPASSPAVHPADSEASPIPSALSPLHNPAPSPSPRPMSMTRTGVPSTIIESPRQSIVDTPATRRESYVSTKTDDSASISSYETGHENFDDDTDQELSTPIAPAPPPASEKASHNLPLQSLDIKANHSPDKLAISPPDQHEMSSATSTETAGSAPARRKSVRMSTLPPQVSATPPALDEYEDENRSPWAPAKTDSVQPNESWNSRVSSANIGWDDSSSEDEEYKAARRALSKADRRSERSRR